MIDAWTSRTPQSTEYPKTETDGVKQLLGIIKGLKTELGEKTSNLFRTAGITITETLMTFANNVRVEGDLSATGTMTVTGDATFQGNLAVPNGSISNEALQNPIEEGAIGYSASGFTVPTSAGAVATRTMNIPDGFTRASVMVVVSFGVWNPTATAGYFYGRATINGTSGAGLPALVQPSGFGTVTTSAIRTLDDLTPGGQVTVSATCNGPSGWGASVSNVVNIDAIAIFRR